ncbi:hypothetical protein Salat_1695000 [Sesamum alatum]|uniref:Uncharacterized protein n=1 Tax=Sesamum alatum TaxID=300844 RepID=A0AAE2CK87_9LAMI|nr:hypothetical protein Salat_1695000 [Sesamum alatum]
MLENSKYIYVYDKEEDTIVIPEGSGSQIRREATHGHQAPSTTKVAKPTVSHPLTKSQSTPVHEEPQRWEREKRRQITGYLFIQQSIIPQHNYSEREGEVPPSENGGDGGGEETQRA